MTMNTTLLTSRQISSRLTWRDIKDRWQARWGIGRMDLTVDPGIYALGKPDANSPVFVSANYKMSFDILRASLSGYEAWILVLDTAGINVWCAAGKGTFGTDELVRRIRESGLADVVAHRRVIVPQLGAVGVAAHKIKQATGFTVVYGPVEAKDLPAFLKAGMRATPAMRRKRFPLGERIALIPMELLPALKWMLLILLVFLLLGGWGTSGGYWENFFQQAPLSIAACALAVIGGAALTPILLPYLPFRAFSLKGAAVGLLCSFLLFAWRWETGFMPKAILATTGWCLIIIALSSFLAMNFTGASTYTSLSGVKKEMKAAIPVQIIASGGGAFLWFLALVLA